MRSLAVSLAVLLLVALAAHAAPTHNAEQKSWIPAPNPRNPNPQGVKVQRRVGQVQTCVNNHLHTLSYDTVGVADEHIYTIESIPDIEDVSCDVDHTRLQIKFHSEVVAAQWYIKLNVLGTYFLTGGQKYGCNIKQNNTDSILVRRVMGADEAGQYLTVKTTVARYDEIYESATIDFSSTGIACHVDPETNAVVTEPSVDKHICLGFNTDCQHGATQQLPLYQNQFITVTCSNCYYGFSADAFIQVKIDDWQLKKLKAGYQNMTKAGALVLDVVAQANWGTGLDKMFNLVPDTQLIGFNIGPVPFLLHFSVPVEVTANIGFQAKAEAIFGVEANWDLGDSYVEWTPDDHWQHVKMSPTVNYTTQFSTSAQFEATASFSVVPTAVFLLDNFFAYKVKFTPAIDGDLKWDSTSKQMCASLTYDLSLSTETDLMINIPWANVHDDWSWTKQLYDSGTQPIAAKCIPTMS